MSTISPSQEGSGQSIVTVPAERSDAPVDLLLTGEQQTEWHSPWGQRLREDPNVTRNTLLVGLAYGTYGDSRTKWWPVWPSGTTIASRTGLSPRTVGRQVKRLKALGYLTRVDRRACQARGVGFGLADGRVRAYLLTVPPDVASDVLPVTPYPRTPSQKGGTP